MATKTPDRDTASSGQEAPARQPRRDPRLGLVVARPFGIPVYISPYWLIFAIFLVVMYANSAEANIASTQSRYIVAAAFVVLLYVSVAVGFAVGIVAITRGVTIEPPRFLTQAVAALTSRFARQAS